MVDSLLSLSYYAKNEGFFHWLKTTSNRWISSHSLFKSFSIHLPPFSPLSISVSQGPHIASVTLAAYECGSVDFPEPPYPDQIVCPQHEAPKQGSDVEQVGVEATGVAPGIGSAALLESISLWTIISKVRLEACMWVSALAEHMVDQLVSKRKQEACAVTLHMCHHFDWYSVYVLSNIVAVRWKAQISHIYIYIPYFLEGK